MWKRFFKIVMNRWKGIFVLVIYTWIILCFIFSANLEKFLLYLILGLFSGLILVLLVIIVRLLQTRTKYARRAKLDISDPIPSSPHPQEVVYNISSSLLIYAWFQSTIVYFANWMYRLMNLKIYPPEIKWLIYIIFTRTVVDSLCLVKYL